MALQTVAEDQLDRKKLATALAGSILSYKRSENLVVGLYGSWGSGKTSLLNMVLDILDKERASGRASDLIIGRFNPWNYADRNALLQQFFGYLSEILQRVDTSEKYTAAAHNIRLLSRTLSVFGGVPVIGGIGKAFEGLADTAKETAEAIGRLDVIKGEISDFLQTNGKRVVVSIDDIDRLTSDETRLIFQLLKSVADFANTTYVLAFDKSVVSAALGRLVDGSGDAYLEKIVSVPIDVPPITQQQISALLEAELKQLQEAQPQYTWVGVRLVSVKRFISRNFRTLRALERFLNSLFFTESLVRGEVDYADFIGINALQVAFPAIYYFIRENSELVLSDADDEDVDPDGARGKELFRLLESVPVARRAEVAQYLCVLFPRLAKVLEVTDTVDIDDDKLRLWRREHRCCAGLGDFEVYFQLAVPEQRVGRAKLEEVLANLDDRAKLLALISELGSVARFRDLLAELRDALPEPLEEAKAKALLSALFSASPMYMTVPDDFGSIYSPVRRSIRDWLLVLSRRERTEFLTGFSDPHGESSLLYVLTMSAILERNKASAYRYPDDALEPAHLGALRSAANEIFREWSSRGVLQDSPNHATLLAAWRNVGKAQDIRDYVTELMKDDNRAIAFLQTFVPVKSARARGIDLRFEALERYIDRDTAEEFITDLATRFLGENKPNRYVDIVIALGDAMRSATKAKSE